MEFATEKEKNSELFEKESALKIERTELENKVDEKQRDLDRVESMLELVKQDCNTRMSEKVYVYHATITKHTLYCLEIESLVNHEVH